MDDLGDDDEPGSATTDPDQFPVVLDDGDVSRLIADIAEFRGVERDRDCEEEGNGAFAAFIDDLEWTGGPYLVHYHPEQRLWCPYSPLLPSPSQGICPGSYIRPRHLRFPADRDFPGGGVKISCPRLQLTRPPPPPSNAKKIFSFFFY